MPSPAVLLAGSLTPDTTGQIAYEDAVVMTFEDGTAILWEDANVSGGGGSPVVTAAFGSIFVIVTL